MHVRSGDPPEWQDSQPLLDSELPHGIGADVIVRLVESEKYHWPLDLFNGLDVWKLKIPAYCMRVYTASAGKRLVLVLALLHCLQYTAIPSDALVAAQLRDWESIRAMAPADAAPHLEEVLVGVALLVLSVFLRADKGALADALRAVLASQFRIFNAAVTRIAPGTVRPLTAAAVHAVVLLKYLLIKKLVLDDDFREANKEKDKTEKDYGKELEKYGEVAFAYSREGFAETYREGQGYGREGQEYGREGSSEGFGRNTSRTSYGGTAIAEGYSGAPPQIQPEGYSETRQEEYSGTRQEGYSGDARYSSNPIPSYSRDRTMYSGPQQGYPGPTQGYSDTDILSYNEAQAEGPTSLQSMLEVGAFEAEHLDLAFRTLDLPGVAKSSAAYWKSDAAQLRECAWALIKMDYCLLLSPTTPLDTVSLYTIRTGMASPCGAPMAPSVPPIVLPETIQQLGWMTVPSVHGMLLPQERGTMACLMREYMTKLKNRGLGPTAQLVIDEANFNIDQIMKLIENSAVDPVVKMRWRADFLWMLG